MAKIANVDQILSIDIGGSNVKATILDAGGNITMEYKRVPTPENPAPKKLVPTIVSLVKGFTSYNKISVGFPGYVKGGVVQTAPNLGTPEWAGFDLRSILENQLKHPVQVINDADLQGLGVVSGKGLELVITLGTGFGTALLLDGALLPHLELAHHPIAKSKTYDQYIGEKAFDKVGVEKWNSRLQLIFSVLKTVFNYDRLYISGGNADKINFPLENNMTVVGNKDGIRGGARLWNRATDQKK